MAVNTADYGPGLSTQDTSRGPSMALWGDFPASDIQERRGNAGVEVFDDFCPVASISTVAAIGTVGQWAAWVASGNTITAGIEEGGVAKLDAGTANKSTILTDNSGCFRFTGGSTAYAYSGGKFWMEIRIALGSIASSQQGVFFGLADSTSSQINSSDTTVIASGGNTLTTTKNLIGVFNRTTTSPADWSAVYQPAGGTAVYPTNLTTLVNTITAANEVAYAASTIKGQGTGFVKLGMKFDPTPGNPSRYASSATGLQTAGSLYKPVIQFYVNGVALPAFLSTPDIQVSTFPTNALFSPVFNYMNIAGATAPVYLDWVRFGQLASY